MARVIAAAFAPQGRPHLLRAEEADVSVGAQVLVPTAHGPEVARCVWQLEEPAWDAVPLLLCGGPASAADLARDDAQRARRAEILRLARSTIAKHRLPMTVVAIDHVDRNIEADRVAVIYFKAPHPVDFRVLLPELARALRARIELRQVGARDVACLCGDVGPCGRELCCVGRGPVAGPVASRGARGGDAQGLGCCGRSRCCQAYEPNDVDAGAGLRSP